MDGNVKSVHTITGTIYQNKKLLGSINSSVKMETLISAPTLLSLESYDGPYTIVPEIRDCNFETLDKRMADDLTVKAIPYHEVSNQNGTTVIIGGEYNG